ncbi:MAG: single-stranded-DNA-specific exonuclease RecJ, partial [SAR202 cluster bacterium]|nr:single-stranded-DNA-specific exonuclease RecJ [SAR202 cluster bacterium]
MPKEWRMLPPPPPGFADGLGLPPFQSHLLYNRGVRGRGQVEPFLDSDSDLRNDPLLLPDMEKGVRRLERALRSGESIGVFGDFDTDGVTATALLTQA